MHWNTVQINNGFLKKSLQTFIINNIQSTSLQNIMWPNIYFKVTKMSGYKFAGFKLTVYKLSGF